MVTISVRDTGVGISPDHLADVFDPFIQAEKSFDQSDANLGLGLSIVRGIVDLHEGSIIAKSDGIGEGSEFIIRLPI